MVTEELPNLALLIKLLKLTASSNDSEALLAVRKANEQLVKFGGDWERLLKGKVTVIGDPFEGVAAPVQRTTPSAAPQRTPQQAPPHPRPQSHWAWARPPQKVKPKNLTLADIGL
jgi:hypothetical protein